MFSGAITRLNLNLILLYKIYDFYTNEFTFKIENNLVKWPNTIHCILVLLYSKTLGFTEFDETPLTLTIISFRKRIFLINVNL